MEFHLISRQLRPFLLLILGLWPALAQTASIPLAWDASSSAGVTGYRLHYGTAPRTYTTQVNVGNVLTATLDGLSEDTIYYFAATAYNTQGLQSAYSNEVTASIPKAPAGLRLTITIDGQLNIVVAPHQPPGTTPQP